MPHIFRFHTGRNNNIYDWSSSDRIQSSDVSEIEDRTITLSSSTGTSIPTPLARMFLFKTSFEIVAKKIQDNVFDKNNNANSIYAGFVSETLDFLELLYKSGGDAQKIEYKDWIFDINQRDNNDFGKQNGHILLEDSFKQAAVQSPFNGRIELSLIFYKENNKKILMGATSPFSFVFTSPNFKRKFVESCKPINGLVSGDFLFDSDYKQLWERDPGFIKYIEGLASAEGINGSFRGFRNYVMFARNNYGRAFNGRIAKLESIMSGNSPLQAKGIQIRKLSEDDYKENINNLSDFKMELPNDSPYNETMIPLFLMDKMNYSGQYTSETNWWNPNTRVDPNSYGEENLDDIKQRELPGMSGIKYPFLSDFDFFEYNLVKLPGYYLNNERFVCIIDDQPFLYPIKPIFFQFFPIKKIKEYLNIQKNDKEITFKLRIPVYGPTQNRRDIVCSKTYSLDSAIEYGGILGIYPITRATDPELKRIHPNHYTIASFEKTNRPQVLNSIKYYNNTGIKEIHPSKIIPRSNYDDINTKTTYYQIDESFDIIQLNFKSGNADFGGVILPIFREDIQNNTEHYVYAIDFGTSNTHVEYGKLGASGIMQTSMFAVDEKDMQMTLLNKPKEVVLNDGAVRYLDYERSMGYTIDTGRSVTLREFIPFQIGSPNASIRFPFRTATCESNGFVANSDNNELFMHANIGFNIDNDALLNNVRYTTNLKWLLSNDINDPYHINRVTIFFRQLLLMIRTKTLLDGGDLNKLQIVISYPISMGNTLRDKLTDLFKGEQNKIFGESFKPVKLVQESVAPFYHLKANDNTIQNDNYCNIDIGGGTTDIVVIDKDKNTTNNIICFCSSFKFAGKQIWSSGNNPYSINDNGFLSYYRKFIERVNPTIYNQFKPIFDHNTQYSTEDLISVLFGKPEYRFSDIFVENKEFKVVLILHYCAILYYISKLAEFKQIALPRTISFSGKGSEYLKILFPLVENLKGFSKLVLDIFSDNKTRSDFNIIRSNEPKVITAKGSVYFATESVEINLDAFSNTTSQSNDKKQLVTEDVKFSGFHDFKSEELNLKNKNLFEPEMFNSILDSNVDFLLKLFDNADLVNKINKVLEIKDFAYYKKEFFFNDGVNVYDGGVLRDSFKSTLETLNPEDTVSDVPFFYPLNYALPALAKFISNKSQS